MGTDDGNGMRERNLPGSTIRVLIYGGAGRNRG